MRRRVRRTGHHAVGQALVHHHGGKVGDVLHRLPRLIQSDALGLTQLREISGEFLQQLRIQVIDDVGFGQVQPQAVRATPNVLSNAQDGDVRNILRQQLIRGLQNAVILALRQHDVLAVGLRAGEQPVLKNSSRHDRLSFNLQRLEHRCLIHVRDHVRDRRPQLLNASLRTLGRHRAARHNKERKTKCGRHVSVKVVVSGTPHQGIARHQVRRNNRRDIRFLLRKLDEVQVGLRGESRNIDAVKTTADRGDQDRPVSHAFPFHNQAHCLSTLINVP